MGKSYHSALSPSKARPLQDPRLNSAHPFRVARVSIVKAVEMKQTMHNIELQLAIERIFELPRLPAGRLRADENFAVLKRDHVRRPGFAHEFSMERSNSSIGNDQDRNFRQSA